MSKSAQSTIDVQSRLTHLVGRIAFVGLLVTTPIGLPATAQEGDVSSKATPPIATTDTIRSIGDAVAPTLPEGAVAPQVIAKTFLATAYCLKGQTASGIPVRRGIIAADPNILPLGSVVRLHAGSLPSASAASTAGPDSRVSRPTTTRGSRPSLAASTRARARPTPRTVAASSGASPARPRIPSVPKSFLFAISGGFYHSAMPRIRARILDLHGIFRGSQNRSSERCLERVHSFDGGR